MAGRPHIAIHVERNADGSHWSAWRCTGRGLFAYGYTPTEAYEAWCTRIASQALLEQTVALVLVEPEGHSLH